MPSDLIIVELIRSLPTLFWVILILILGTMYRTPITHLIPNVESIKAFGFEASFISKELDKVAQEKPSAAPDPASHDRIGRRAMRISSLLSGVKILLVNDHPSEMLHVIKMLESLHVHVHTVNTTEDALAHLIKFKYDLIISDMSRNGVSDEGLRLLEKSRLQRIDTPIIFTLGRYDPNRGTPPHAFGITNRVDQLLDLIFDVVERIRG